MTEDEEDQLLLRLNRVEYAIECLAAWLVQAQSGFGELDAKGIYAILEGRQDEPMFEYNKRKMGET